MDNEMNTQENPVRYRTVEANNTSFILSEDMALNLVASIFKEFDWSGTFFTPEDVRTGIVHEFLSEDHDLPEGAVIEKMVSSVMCEADWKHLGDIMELEGSSLIADAIGEAVYSYMKEQA